MRSLRPIPKINPAAKLGTAAGSNKFTRVIGIAEKFQDRIFGLFDRLDGQEVDPGTGIGLAIAKKGVDRMGGAIGLESTLGTGTRFWVKLHKCEC